jgi:cytochrome c-type biogenesis protein CcmH/NrfF
MRVIWLLIAEAFFVGGYATLLNAHQQAKNHVYGGQQDLLFWILPFAALIAALLACAAVAASANRVMQFQACYQRYEERTGAEDDSTDGYPPLQDHRLVQWLTTISLFGLPVLFVILWAVVLAAQITNRVAG